MSAPSWSTLGRTKVDVGDLLDSHSGGLLPGDLGRFKDDPVGFDRWGGREPQPYQEEIMRSVVSCRYTAAKGAQGVGKDWLLGGLAIWAAYAKGMLVLVLSGTQRQVQGQSMREVIRAWRDHHRAGHELQGEAFRGALRIGGEDRILGITGGATADAIQGFHDERGVLVLVSESQSEALDASVYETFDAVTTNERSRIVVLGNPIRPHGGFWEVFQRRSWNRFTVSAFDTPNVRQGEQIHPAFPYPGWPQDMAREHGGEESPWYVARVLGQFPEQGESALISATAWDATDDPERAERELKDLHRDQSQGRAPRAVLSVDVAREGPDATALALRWGGVLLRLERYREPDAIENARRIAQSVRQLINPGGIPIGSVVVDEVALGGGVLDQLTRDLREVGWHQPVMSLHPTLHWAATQAVGFKSSRRAPSPERFVDTRSQSFWHLRDEIERGAFVVHPQTDRELLGELREEILAHDFQHGGDDRIRVLAKDEIRSRVGRSPDLADALSMSYLTALQSSKPRKRVAFR